VLAKDRRRARHVYAHAFARRAASQKRGGRVAASGNYRNARLQTAAPRRIGGQGSHHVVRRDDARQFFLVDAEAVAQSGVPRRPARVGESGKVQIGRVNEGLAPFQPAATHGDVAARLHKRADLPVHLGELLFPAQDLRAVIKTWRAARLFEHLVSGGLLHGPNLGARTAYRATNRRASPRGRRRRRRSRPAICPSKAMPATAVGAALAWRMQSLMTPHADAN
jgi:hypothetical protein